MEINDDDHSAIDLGSQHVRPKTSKTPNPQKGKRFIDKDDGLTQKSIAKRSRRSRTLQNYTEYHSGMLTIFSFIKHLEISI